MNNFKKSHLVGLVVTFLFFMSIINGCSFSPKLPPEGQVLRDAKNHTINVALSSGLSVEVIQQMGVIENFKIKEINKDPYERDIAIAIVESIDIGRARHVVVLRYQLTRHGWKLVDADARVLF